MRVIIHHLYWVCKDAYEKLNLIFITTNPPSNIENFVPTFDAEKSLKNLKRVLQKIKKPNCLVPIYRND